MSEKYTSRISNPGRAGGISPVMPRLRLPSRALARPDTRWENPGRRVEGRAENKKGKLMLTRFTLAVVASLTAAALLSSAAFGRALDLYDFSATGIETGVPSNNVSPFSGTAVGTGGFAIWSASVSRTALDPCATTTILGGPFSLTGSGGVKLTGTFNSGGTVTAPGGFCS